MIQLSRYKGLMLPVAIIGGALGYRFMDRLAFLSPYLIFTMLTITYCRLKPSDLRPGKEPWLILAVQTVMATAVFFALDWWNKDVAAGVMLCVMVPTATAAPVITAMLGGSLPMVATLSLLSNVAAAFVAPAVLAAVGVHGQLDFWNALAQIAALVLPLLLFPLALAFAMRAWLPKIHNTLANHQSLSFYIWAISLFIIVGSSVSFIINHYQPGQQWTMLALALGSLLVCLLQFVIGRKVGRAFGDSISAGQGLGQKNTVLAVWLAVAYLNPVASVAPAAYVAWQNIINSWEIARHKNNHLKIQNR